jgi:hypothetical protein
LLALSTRCAPEDWPLDRTVASLRELGVEALALHRPATPEEARALVPWTRRVRIVAVFGDEPGGSLRVPLLVVEGGPAGPDRESSLEQLCRRLHALRAPALALRTPESPEDHPAPEEIALVAESLRNVGYWHDAQRGGGEYLHAAAGLVRGASFHPLVCDDLVGIRDTLSSAAPAVVDCPPGTSKEELREALGHARSYFRV